MDKKDEEILQQAQLYSQQIQNIMAQKTAMILELNEVKKSLEELNKTEEKDVYKLSGHILIKIDREKAKKDLEDKKETLELRIKTLERQEERLKERLEEFRTKLIKVKDINSSKKSSEEE